MTTARRLSAALIAACALTLPIAAHAEYRIEEVASALLVSPQQLKPRTIVFGERRAGGNDDSAGLLRYPDWGQVNPLQKQWLSLYPGYGETTGATPSPAPAGGSEGDAALKPADKLYVYVVEARFAVSKPATSFDLGGYATLPFVNRLDPAIKNQTLAAADAMPAVSADYALNRNPERNWCEGRDRIVCLQSHYDFEGRLPTGIVLANKLTDTAKKIPPFLDFQSELRPLAPDELADPALAQLTGIDTPVAGALEQSIFYVNQIMQFGKFLAVVQPDPNDAGKSVATVQMALAVKGSVFDRKREYERVPILRNLVPAQVLLGKSSFNTGASISAGLPAYTRNRIITVANILNGE